MNLTKTPVMPEYTDGYFLLYDIVDEADGDLPVHKIRPRMAGAQPVKVWFRELALFDRTRATLQQSDVEVTMKVAVPRWTGYSTRCVCLIHDYQSGEDVQHRVYNNAAVLSKQGYPESELTLVNVEVPYEVVIQNDNDKGSTEQPAP